jgi:ligand-binding sensor domain-containing protein
MSFKKLVIPVVIVAGLIVGAYWFGINQGAARTEVAVLSTTTEPSVSPTPVITQAAQNKSNFTHFRVGNRNVKSIYAETDKVWVGTSGGVIRYDPEADDYRLFDFRNGLLANGIFHVSRWTENKMLVGTYGGGLAVYDEIKDKFEIFNVPDGLADAFVYDVMVMPNDDLWIATWSGANRVKGGRLADPAAWETYTVENTNGGLPNDWVYGLDLGKNGEVWLATEGGLARFHDNQWANWNHADGQGADYELVKNDNTFDTDPATMSSHHAQSGSAPGAVASPVLMVKSLLITRSGTDCLQTMSSCCMKTPGEHYGLAPAMVYRNSATVGSAIVSRPMRVCFRTPFFPWTPNKMKPCGSVVSAEFRV